MEVIICNSWLRLISYDLNLIMLDKFILETLNKRYQTFAFFVVFLLKIIMEVREYCTIWDKTQANFDFNTRLSFKSFSKNVSGVKSKNKISKMPFKSNISYIINVFRFR